MAVTLTINRRKVVASEGDTILEAARGAGIKIPTLCHHPDLSKIGACRLCVVSVEKARALQTACTTPVFDGMVVDTESEASRETRRFVLEMLLSDHPNECMTCEVNGDCELQNLAYEYDVPWPQSQGKHHSHEVNPDPNPFVYIDRNKCVLCGRCVRACAEIQGRNVWSYASRGFDSKLVAGADQPMLEARCESCGQCVAYCPIGALDDKMSLKQARANKVSKVRTTCTYCGVGCHGPECEGWPGHPRHLQSRCAGQRHAPVRQGTLRLRLRPPLRPPDQAAGAPVPAGRRAKRQRGTVGEWVEVDWDTALDISRAQAAQRPVIRYGADSIGVLTSAKCLNEENYLMNKLARQVIGTNNIDHCARL